MPHDITIDYDGIMKKLLFQREEGGALVPTNGPSVGTFASVALASGGDRAIEVPTMAVSAEFAPRTVGAKQAALPGPAAARSRDGKQTR